MPAPASSDKPAMQQAGASGEAIDAQALVPAHLLDGGEIVIFAIKPSMWFIVYVAFRWVAALGMIALLGRSIGQSLPDFDESIILQLAALLAGARIVVALMQWVSRLYVLTNRRILRVTGVTHVDIFECPLTQIQSLSMDVAWFERPAGTGSLHFVTAPGGAVEVSWYHVDNPAEIHERVRAAIHRAKS